MLTQENQKIRTRQLEIDLSDSDLTSLINKAGNVGITVNELLGSFIGDLVHGSLTHGSDERDMAEGWFERCGFEYVTEKSFLKFALTNNCVDEILDLQKDIQGAQKEILDMDAYPEDYEAGDLASVQEYINGCQDEINGFWNEYRNDFLRGEPGHQAETLEGELEKLLCWQKDCQKMMEGKAEKLENSHEFEIEEEPCI